MVNDNKTTSEELKKIIKKGNLVIGTELSIKKLKTGAIEKLFYTHNCPAKLKAEIEHYSKINKTEIEELEVNNEELGVLCKKPFSITVLGLAK